MLHNNNVRTVYSKNLKIGQWKHLKRNDMKQEINCAVERGKKSSEEEE